ncbi:RNA-binding CRM domain [Arabidopsis suecica]|uniref:RNA-binding CRM domain n=2 Tax=Arabidopsis suecica TaxID=45249 RepID=A0A8T2F8N9_ARASU|nr:RNA-binding CRM domain [Arabidopsis suecica]
MGFLTAAIRVSTSAASMLLCRKSRKLGFLASSSPLFSSLNSMNRPISSVDIVCKVLHKESLNRPMWNVSFLRSSSFHSTPARETGDDISKSVNSSSQDGDSSTKLKRKKLKGKRAVVRWLKFFRWKKKKEFERMTSEEKILNKLRKARKKEERLMETMKKLEPSESAETTHDPEILTPEEHFYYLKMGLKCKNYVPVGRRGIYQGVILNMHLHWKKHQTLQVVIKTFTPDEVKEIAVELARLTGGIVLDVHDGNTIIMYRGKNYVQPPTEIMSPRITLPRKKALDKSKCRDALRAVRKYIPRLEQELQLLQAQAETKRDYMNVKVDDTQERSEELKKIIESSEECLEDEQEEGEEAGSELATDSDLSDIFETDSELEDEKTERPLFLEEFEKFPARNNREDEDFGDLEKAKSEGEENDDDKSPNFDEVDKMFLRAAFLLKKKRR